MKPFVFRFFEEPPNETLPAKEIEYCEQRHLHVLTGTAQPAINVLSFDTDTFTKAAVDTNEHDHQPVSILNRYLDTQIQTRAAIDQTESDYPQ